MHNLETESYTKRAINNHLKKNIKLLSDEIDTTNRDYKESEYHNEIALAAYYKAEKRGFAGSEADALQDWLEAEMEIKLINVKLIP